MQSSPPGGTPRGGRRGRALQAIPRRKRDELVALQILYRLPYAQRRLTYQALDDLRDAMRRPPWLLQPPDIWRAYKRLAADKVRGNPAGTLADIVMLVRYAIGEARRWSRCRRSSPAASTSGSAARRGRGAYILTSSALGSPRSATTSPSTSRRRRTTWRTRRTCRARRDHQGEGSVWCAAAKVLEELTDALVA